VHSALVIQSGHAIFARQVIGVFFLVPGGLAEGRAAGPAHTEQNQSGPAQGSVGKRHAANLSELTVQRNDGVEETGETPRHLTASAKGPTWAGRWSAPLAAHSSARAVRAWCGAGRRGRGRNSRRRPATPG